MSFINWIKKINILKKTPLTKEENKKWIELYFSILIDVENNKKNKKYETYILEMAKNIENIFVNTNLIFNTKNEYMGTINPYLGINTILSFTQHTKNQILRPLSAIYYIEITKKVKGNWYPINKNIKSSPETFRIKATPFINNKPAKFTFLEFYYEKLGLDNISKWICELNGFSERDASFNIFINNGQPGIEEQDNPNLFKIKYLVEDRLKYLQKKHPELEKEIFNGNILNYVNNIKENKIFNKKMTINQKIKKSWLIKVNNLIKKYNI
jgi:hypothetical protein